MGDDVLPVVEDIYYVGHATTRAAADRILTSGLNRQQRLHVHFYECNRYGPFPHGSVHGEAEVLIAVSASHARQDGVVFHRSSNNVILSAGHEGVIAPRYFRYIYQLPRLNPIWPRQSGAEENLPGEQPNGLLPSQCGFGPWFGDEDLFGESDEEVSAERVPNEVPEDSTEMGRVTADRPSEGSTVIATPRRVPINPVFLRPRGRSPISSDGGDESRLSNSPSGNTAGSVITRPIYVARSSTDRLRVVKEEGNSPEPSVIARPARSYSPYNRGKASRTASEAGDLDVVKTILNHPVGKVHLRTQRAVMSPHHR